MARPSSFAARDVVLRKNHLSVSMMRCGYFSVHRFGYDAV
jgi:hypothetical protein